MNKLLTGTVSWQRPELCRKMIKSFLKTRKVAELFVYICNDDPKLEEYKEMIKEFPEVWFEIGPHLYIAEVSNYMSSKFDFEYYQMINDDHEFIGEGWDEDMTKGLDEDGGWRLAASYMPEELMKKGEDCDFTPINAPTAEIFSRKIVRALGFYNFPEFKQYGCDQYIMELGQDLGGIIPFSGKILHNSWHGLNRMEKDATAAYIYSQENMIQGNIAIMSWMQNRQKIVNKIKEAKENER
ncbi:hypothetical protein KKF82_07865 [Patescibacteria group bacterium]|nr:hypothetical protein [Patescibacteria group bacterium]